MGGRIFFVGANQFPEGFLDYASETAAQNAKILNEEMKMMPDTWISKTMQAGAKDVSYDFNLFKMGVG